MGKTICNTTMTTTLLPNKKQRSSIARNNSRIFAPFRVIGNVSCGIPFAVGSLGSTFYIVTSVGNTFQIYDASTLHLLFVSARQTPAPITCLAAHFQYTYAGYGNNIGIFARGELLHELQTKGRVSRICVFGEYLCAATSDRTIHVFRKVSPQAKFAVESYTELQLADIHGPGEIVEVLHLPTYLNKIAVITTSAILLFNIRTGKLIYESPSFPSQITTAEIAPVLDVVGLATIEGDVILFNLKKGRKIRQIQIPNMKISSLSFRTDGQQHMSVCSMNGDMVFYDLDRKSRIHVMRNVHKEKFGGITKGSFLNGQPIIVTSGGDNALKEFVFDPSLSTSNADSVVQPPRFLRSRGGHSEPPSSILFADNESHFILSASRDRSLWGFSLRKDAQSQELSQREHKDPKGNRLGGSTVRQKFPEIISIAIENTRLGEWDNVITAHQNEKFARTWDTRSKRVGKHRFSTTDDGVVKSVGISQCGNFGLVGSSNGSITVYNMQSGMLRRKYKFHKKAVTGLALDGSNSKMVSCGLDGLVGFYDFNNNALLGKLQLDAPITQMVYHRSSDLCAMALDDFSIIVIDTVTQKIVRQLWGHSNRVTAFDFAPNGRWIVSAALDSTIRTWDLPTGGCIDGIVVESVATNVKFSPNADIIATTHVDVNGICIWTNKSQFKGISTRHIDEENFMKVQLPNASIQGNESLLAGAFADDNESQDLFNGSLDTYDSVDQINDQLITLSLGPRSKMQTLLNLDVIRARAKPTVPIKKPDHAPFFLQFTGEKVGDEASGREGKSSGLTDEIKRAQSDLQEKTSIEQNMNRFKPTGRVGFESKFTKLLREGSASGDFSDFLLFVVQLSAGALDLEIRSLDSFEPLNEIVAFIRALLQGVETNKNFELYMTFMSLLFKCHGDVIHSHTKTNSDLAHALQEWEITIKKVEHLDEIVKYCSSVLSFISVAN